MRSGRLRKVVDLQSMVEVADATGQLIQTPTTIGTYRAEIKPLAGLELVNARQVRADVGRQINFVDDKQITEANRRSALAGNFISLSDVDHVNERVNQLR